MDTARKAMPEWRHTITNGSELILTREQLAFQAVLDSFAEASDIWIVTYHALNRHRDLMAQLRSTGAGTRIVFGTNVPNSHTRTWDNNRESFIKEYKRYLAELHPDNIGSGAEVYLVYDNHAKIIATNKLAYIGSANFTPASANNFECGLLTSNHASIGAAIDNVRRICESGLRFWGSELSTALAIIAGAFERCVENAENLCSICEGAEIFPTHEDGNPWVQVRSIEAQLEIIDEVLATIASAAEWESVKDRLIGEVETHRTQLSGDAIDAFRHFDSHRYRLDYFETHSLEKDDPEEVHAEAETVASDEYEKLLTNVRLAIDSWPDRLRASIRAILAVSNEIDMRETDNRG
jgi:hypothetical protein